MTKRPTFDELLSAPTQISLINEPPTFEVDYVVREETALDRAHRRWGNARNERKLKEPNQ